jgi:glycosyltransferase involved in cell wall biosynthesis
MVGTVPPSEFGAFLADADLGHAIHENTGLNMTITLPSKVFDYMHAGVPVICGNGPEVSRIVTENRIGWSVDPEEPTSLARGVSAFLNARPGLGEYRRRCRELAAKYCWEVEAEKYVRFTEQALGVTA